MLGRDEDNSRPLLTQFSTQFISNGHEMLIYPKDLRLLIMEEILDFLSSFSQVEVQRKGGLQQVTVQ